MIAWLKSKLVDDISAIWHRWSLWIMGMQAVVVATWTGLSLAGLTPDLSDWVKGLVSLVFILAALGAMPIKQKGADA